MLLDGTETGFTYPAAPANGAAAASNRTHAWKDGGSFSFHDLLDTLNPLQHIPIVGALYRWATGDEPGNVARVVGDTLYGGPIGLAVGLFSVATKEETGKDPGELAMAALTGSGQDQGGGTAMAESPAPSAPAAPTQEAAPAMAAVPASPAVAAVSKAAAFEAHGLPLAGRIPMPLSKSAPVPASASIPAAAATPEQAFLAQNAALQRTALGARGGAPARSFTAPIPLQLSGGALRPRPLPAAASAPVPPGAAAAARALPQNMPVDVPQRMIDALDKYMQMQKQKQAQTRGSAVDVSN